METTDVLIIGGSAAGMVTALTGRANWPDKKFTLVKKQKDVMVPCGIPYIFGTLEGIDRHPGSLPNSHKQTVKLIAAKHSGVIIGGEVIGGLEAGELTNVIGLAIQNRMSVNSFLTMQIGTHPCLTASPAA